VTSPYASPGNPPAHCKLIYVHVNIKLNCDKLIGNLCGSILYVMTGGFSNCSLTFVQELLHKSAGFPGQSSSEFALIRGQRFQKGGLFIPFRYAGCARSVPLLATISPTPSIQWHAHKHLRERRRLQYYISIGKR